VGEKWTLLILRESFYGATRFEQFHSVLNCPRNLLSERLTKLVDEGILERSEYREPGSRARNEYRMTDMGRELVRSLLASHAVGRSPQGRSRRAARARAARRVRQGLRVTLDLRKGHRHGPDRHRARRRARRSPAHSCLR
jgi:DNA-binding HxlR family transcriptional regulator